MAESDPTPVLVPQKPTRTGGMGEVHEANEEVQGYLDQVKAAAEEAAGRSFAMYEAVQFASQLVNGINYFIKVNTGDDKYIFVRLHKPFQGDTVSFHSLKDGMGKEDTLVYI